MKHRATPDFWYYYRQLPPYIQDLADKCYELLKQDPYYPSLHFKKVDRFWTVRIEIHYRAIAVADGQEMAWFWIGHHAEYDKILQK
ncbi:MAG: hypothetical protein VKJ02_09285 [Snowella sp.]|nr:hypothetical protein [Snowella sp.]